MAQLPEVDAVIIGAGWAGGILAAELTRAGMTVVALERGRPRSTQDFQHVHDELRYAVDLEMMMPETIETVTLRHDLRERALPIRRWGSFLPGIGVGGAGVHWNGQTYRFHPDDFRKRSHYEQRYGRAAIPADMTIQDWGITYEQLEPYYDRYEYLLGTSGKAGNIKGKIQSGGNPFEGARSRDYPTPPMKMPPALTMFAKAASDVGMHPFPQPSSNLSQQYTNPDGVTRAACTYCGFCERFGCEVGAKADPTVTVLPLAQRTGKYQLRTGCSVTRIDHDGKRASGVTYLDPAGNVQQQPAHIVIVAAWTFNNVKLLLLSKLGRPYDPVSGDGVVGKNYSYQTQVGHTPFFRDQHFRPYMGAGGLGMTLDDLGSDNFDHHGLGFLGGGAIFCQQTGGRPIQQGTATPKGTPKWGPQWKAALKQWYGKSWNVVMEGESPSYRTHSLDLDPTYRDAYGDPLLRICFDWTDNERKLVAYTAKKIEALFKAAGATMYNLTSTLPKHYDTVAYQSTHNVGGAIMGGDPHTSVVNNYSQMWDYDNVFVVGASSFPQNASFNPTDTVGALALRCADGITKRYKNRPGPLA